MKTKSEVVAKHTKGPWKIDNQLGYVETETGKQICKMYSLNWGAEQTGRLRASPSLEAEANARLIASAPDLLEVLKGWVAAYEQSEDGVTLKDLNGKPVNMAEIAKAAISKATQGGR